MNSHLLTDTPERRLVNACLDRAYWDNQAGLLMDDLETVSSVLAYKAVHEVYLKAVSRRERAIREINELEEGLLN